MLEELGLDPLRVDLLPLILLNHDHLTAYNLMDIRCLLETHILFYFMFGFANFILGFRITFVYLWQITGIYVE